MHDRKQNFLIWLKAEKIKKSDLICINLKNL